MLSDTQQQHHLQRASPWWETCGFSSWPPERVWRIMPSKACPKAYFSIRENILKSVGTKMQPCFSPLTMLKATEVKSLNWTVHFISLWKDLGCQGGGGSWFFAAVWRAHPCWPGQKLLSIFIPELTHGEHHVDSGPLSMKATLRFRSCSASFCNLVRRTLAMNLQTMLRREIPRSYTVWWCLHHLRHTALLPTSGDHVVQWGSKSQKIVLQQIGGMPSFPGALPGFNCLTVCTSWSIVGSASSKAHPVEEGYTGI